MEATVNDRLACASKERKSSAIFLLSIYILQLYVQMATTRIKFYTKLHLLITSLAKSDVVIISGERLDVTNINSVIGIEDWCASGEHLFAEQREHFVTY